MPPSSQLPFYVVNLLAELASKPVRQWVSPSIYTSVRYRSFSLFPLFNGKRCAAWAVRTLKLLFLFYKPDLVFTSFQRKRQVKKQANCRFFYYFTPWHLSVFKHRTCVLYHLAFLEWLPTRNFPSPITHILPLKRHFLTAILPFPTIKHMVRRGFIYTISLNVYAYQVAFNCILYCVLYLFTLHLASKRTAFSTKMHYVLHQNTLHLAAYCTAFSTKTHESWCKWWCFLIKIHFAAFTYQPPFASKQTFARIDFLHAGLRLVEKTGTHNVKILTKNQTKQPCVYMCMGYGKESMYAYGGQCERLQGIHLLSRICAALATA